MEPVNYIQAKEISKAYGEKALFSNISVSIAQGQKVALIARNGSGKTTLLRILAGEEAPDDGHCTYRSGLRVAYLHQEPVFPGESTVAQALLSADNEQTKAIRAYEEFVSDPLHAGIPMNANRLQELIERMDSQQAWDYEQRVKQVLTMLQIRDLKARVDSLSGGQVKRLALGKILIEDPDFLLLDEPTNHLDIAMIEWLESFLEKKKTTLLMVTHDRYFLDTVCNVILEMENGTIHTYKGNYSYFLEKKQERNAAEHVQNLKAQNLLRKESEWMRRSPPARTSKSKARKTAYQFLKERASTGTETVPGDIRMEMTRMGKKILELKNVRKAFGDKTVVRDFSYVFKRGERIGIVGPNGTGKSTLLNCITGAITPDAGKITTGETIRFGYFRQEGIAVNDDKKVIETITYHAERIRIGKDHWLSAAQFLRHFNFPNHMHYDRVGKLSGGEKRKLYLMTILMQNPNFLILDEPTNDLDIDTLNILEEFLETFPGCLLIVSHDRYFLDRLSDQLFVFKQVGDIAVNSGNYTEYRQKEKARGTEEKTTYPKKEKGGKQQRLREKTKLSFKEQKEFDTLEKEIASLEKEKEELLEKMNSGALSPEDLHNASTRFRQVEHLLGIKSDRWLELSEYT